MNKKLLFISLFVLLISSTAFSQSEAKKIQNEINTKIWKPFIVAYNNLDAKAFNALHTDDVMRVNQWGMRIGEEYKASNTKNFEKSKAKGAKRTIELWLEDRQTNASTSYEVGYYKVTNYSDEGEKIFYGRFHVIIKKINGEWKIAQDWDTNQVNGIKITEEDYTKNTPLTFN